MKVKIKKLKTAGSNGEREKAEQRAVSLYDHIKEISKLKYESEMRREDSLVQQSSHMQTAFSFVTASIFMAAPVMIENKGKLSLLFFFAAFSSIVLCLVICLITASWAQKRRLTQTFMSIPDIENFVLKNKNRTLKKSAQLKQWVQVVGSVQTALEKVNRKRTIFIRISMASFLISILLIMLWYIIALEKLFY